MWSKQEGEQHLDAAERAVADAVVLIPRDAADTQRQSDEGYCTQAITARQTQDEKKAGGKRGGGCGAPRARNKPSCTLPYLELETLMM